MKLQHLQNQVLRDIGNFPRRTGDRELHKTFNSLYIYDYVIKLCSNKQESYKFTKMHIFATLDRVKPDTENKSLQVGVGQAYDR